MISAGCTSSCTGTLNVTSFPSRARPVTVPMTDAMIIGLNVWMVKSPRIISRANNTPAKGALNEAAIPAAAPHPTSTRILSVDK